MKEKLKRSRFPATEATSGSASRNSRHSDHVAAHGIPSPHMDGERLHGIPRCWPPMHCPVCHPGNMVFGGGKTHLAVSGGSEKLDGTYWVILCPSSSYDLK